ncbi:hypothetical protein DFAR_3610030 [Desulfarculales bacterium]
MGLRGFGHHRGRSLWGGSAPGLAASRGIGDLWRTMCNTMVLKARSARQMLRVLKGNGLVGVLLDQNVDWYDGEWVDFFGRLACTNKGLALLAMATDASPDLSQFSRSRWQL